MQQHTSASARREIEGLLDILSKEELLKLSQQLRTRYLAKTLTKGKASSTALLNHSNRKKSSPCTATKLGLQYEVATSSSSHALVDTIQSNDCTLTQTDDARPSLLRTAPVAAPSIDAYSNINQHTTDEQVTSLLDHLNSNQELFDFYNNPATCVEALKTRSASLVINDIVNTYIPAHKIPYVCALLDFWEYYDVWRNGRDPKRRSACIFQYCSAWNMPTELSRQIAKTRKSYCRLKALIENSDRSIFINAAFALKYWRTQHLTLGQLKSVAEAWKNGQSDYAKHLELAEKVEATYKQTVIAGEPHRPAPLVAKEEQIASS